MHVHGFYNALELCYHAKINTHSSEISAHSRPNVIALYIISSMLSQCGDYVSESPARAPMRARGEVTLFIAGRLDDVLWWNFLWILGCRLSSCYVC